VAGNMHWNEKSAINRIRSFAEGGITKPISYREIPYILDIPGILDILNIPGISDIPGILDIYTL
jgi:hypothetical protein